MKKNESPIIPEPVRALLVKAARQAATLAYCPYSHFQVGAALLTLDGQIYTGCNIENASFSLTQCAERTALFKAVSDGQRSFAALAIAGGDQQPASPCGACRQVLVEFCAPDMPVFIARLKIGKPLIRTLGELLPLSFEFKH
jgi:cytidine deaminase